MCCLVEKLQKNENYDMQAADIKRTFRLSTNFRRTNVIEVNHWAKVANKQQILMYKTAVYTRERTIIRSVSYRNRYWVYRIESYRLLLYRPILRASLQVQHELLTGRIKQQIKGHSRRHPSRGGGSPARARGRLPHAGAPYDPGYGRGLVRWEEGDCNLIPASP